MTAREAAYQWIRSIEKGAYSNLVMNSTDKLSDEDKSFSAKLALTTVERRLTLEHILRKYSKKPIEKLDAPVRIVLLMGLCQLLYMNVPDSAAVNESVKLIKKLRYASAGTMVNGILRSFIRDGKVIPPVDGDECERLSVAYSVPVGLIRKILAAYGRENTLIWLDRLDAVPDTYISTNITKTNRDELMRILADEGTACEAGEVNNSIKLDDPDFSADSFVNGLYHVQGLSSQMCADMMDAQNGDVIIDICGAPGGKSFTMAENGAKVISCELYEHRAGLILRDAKRLGLDIEVAVNDGTVYSEKLAACRPNKILCDVPCSGFGVSGKPEIRYKSLEMVSGLPEIQYKILCTSAEYLSSGGVLIYSTCTVDPDENEEITHRFARENPFDIVSDQMIFAKDRDGFYICKMIKR